MEAITIGMMCPDCQRGCVTLVGSGLRWTRQCSSCGITEIITAERKREFMEASVAE